MRLSLITLSLALVLLAAAVVPVPALARPALSARLSACTTGADTDARAATFTGSMPAIAGTRRMAMRFDLLQRRKGDPAFAPVDVPGWGAWERSDPGRPGFVLVKRVEALVAPASYRAVVSFRWLDRHGRVIRQASRTTPRCQQPDPRPDLGLARFSATAGAGGTATYTIVVANSGRADAGTFQADLLVGGAALGPLTLGPLAPGTSERASIGGPACAPGSTVTIRLDTTGAVDEAREDDDVVQRACPL